MKSFPMFLQMAGRRVVIVGGGEQAAQKARLMIRTEAALTLIAPVLEDELAALVARGRAQWHAGPMHVGDFVGAALVFVATGCPALDACAHALAKAAGALVNVVDQPALCDAITPSIVDRDPVVVAIGTEGTAPVLARQIKSQIEVMLEPRLGALAALAGRLRDAVAVQVPKAARRALWEWAFAGAPRQLFARGAEAEGAVALKQAIAAGVPDGQQGSIALVGAGPGSADLLTLRAVQRLQQADVIFYDRLVDPSVLELARRDALRVYVGKEVGGTVWPQDRICGLIVAHARQGQRVVRLKSGDPGIFGRATEEIAAARAAGIAVEIVPGITAACAAAASIGRALTERGATDHLVLATGSSEPGAAAPDWAAMLRPGATLALYMAVREAPAIAAALLAAGHPPELPVEVISEAATPRERVCSATIGSISDLARSGAIANPAILLIRQPRQAATAAAARLQPAA